MWRLYKSTNNNLTFRWFPDSNELDIVRKSTMDFGMFNIRSFGVTVRPGRL